MPFDPKRPARRTRYGGVSMRSRLEASWGEYFDAAGIPWSYEPYYFVFPDAGRHYLPDFYLPRVNRYAEVKPCEPDDLEYLRCRLLAEWLMEPVFFLIDKPWRATVLALRPALWNGRPFCVVDTTTLDELTGKRVGLTTLPSPP